MNVMSTLRVGLMAALIGLAPAGCATVATGPSETMDEQQVQQLNWQMQLTQQMILEQGLLASQQAQQMMMMMSSAATPPP